MGTDNVNPTHITQPIIYQFNVSVAPPQEINIRRLRLETAKRSAARLLREQYGYKVLLEQSSPYLWYTDGQRVVEAEVRWAVNHRPTNGYPYRFQARVEGRRLRPTLSARVTSLPGTGGRSPHRQGSDFPGDDGQQHPFFIPMSAVGQRRNINITTHPATAQNQWTPWLNNWEVLPQMLAEAPAGQGWGMTLFE